MIAEQLEEIFNMRKEEAEREFAPYFYQYFKGFFDSPARLESYYGYCRYIFDITEAKNGKVLDVGCGFGLMSIYLAISGAQMVSGVDANEEKIEVFKKILSRFTPPPSNIEARLGDALNLEYESGHFDAAFVHEVISHVRDVDSFIQEMNRVLRKGGILFISDGNNALNIFERLEVRKFWRSRECGPVPEASLRGTDKPLPWLLIRREMIQSSYPHLDEKTLNLLASKTAGMYGNQILEAVEEYSRAGRIINKPAFKFRDPVTGEYNEYEFNPYALKRKLEKVGFSAEVAKPCFSKSRQRGFLKNLAIYGLRASHPLSLVITPFFNIVARKK